MDEGGKGWNPYKTNDVPNRLNRGFVAFGPSGDLVEIQQGISELFDNQIEASNASFFGSRSITIMDA